MLMIICFCKELFCRCSKLSLSTNKLKAGGSRYQVSTTICEAQCDKYVSYQLNI